MRINFVASVRSRVDRIQPSPHGVLRDICRPPKSVRVLQWPAINSTGENARFVLDVFGGLIGRGFVPCCPSIRMLHSNVDVCVWVVINTSFCGANPKALCGYDNSIFHSTNVPFDCDFNSLFHARLTIVHSVNSLLESYLHFSWQSIDIDSISSHIYSMQPDFNSSNNTNNRGKKCPYVPSLTHYEIR